MSPARPSTRTRVRPPLALALWMSFGACSREHPAPGDPPPSGPAEPAPQADAPLPAPAPPASVRGRKLLAEASSAYSRIRVRQEGKRRTIGFVRERGDEFVQTILDLEHPDDPAHPYVETMCAPLLAAREYERLLIIGLGGGSLVRVLHARLPQARLDVVEIDPEVVRLAAEWFGVVPGPRLRIITGDGVEFLAAEGDAYDVIWLDAFLDPGAPGTDDAGVPEGLRGDGFLRRVRARLRPGGVAAFNVHYRSGYRDHVDAIAAVFPDVRAAWPRGALQLIVLAGETATDAATLRARGEALDATGRWGGLAALAATIEPWTRPPAP